MKQGPQTSASQPTGLSLDGAWEVGVSPSRVDLSGDAREALGRAGIELHPASVPGNLELDLERAGLIDDTFRGTAIVEARRLETLYAYYVKTFRTGPAQPGHQPYLVFEGLDCDACIILNGHVVAHTSNMLIEHRVPVAAALLDSSRDQDNVLVVQLAPVTERAERMASRGGPGLMAEGGNYASLFVRKAPHMYGWDIMPRALSAGIWRSVRLSYARDERIDHAWLDTERLDEQGHSAALALHYDIRAHITPSELWELLVVASGDGDGGGFEHRETLTFGVGAARFDVSSPRLWWPKGRGTPHLYDVTVSVLRDGALVDALSFAFGIRVVELERTSVTDKSGTGEFRFVVNGEPVFVLGTNWVPLDAYHSRDLARLPQAIAMVDDLGCNMIRCWGGNVYESDAFYDACDRSGILVWQDFAMACAIYPQDEAFQQEIADEVRQVVRRLRQHPCVALWAGDNECDEQYVWKARRRDPNDNVLTRRVIPAVLEAEDPSRAYLPSSPYVDEVAYASGERLLPEDHLWGPRDYYKSEFYLDPPAHFASEIGYHGCPDPESVAEFISPERLWPPTDNPEWLLHATSPYPGIDTHDYRVELMSTQIRALFGAVPDTLEDFARASQATQAEALKFFIETFRAAKWRRTGIIWWNLLDGWPQFSDAIVDYYFRRKLAYWAVKRAQAPLCLILREPVNGSQSAVFSNDTRHDQVVTFSIRDVRTDQVVLEGTSLATADSTSSAGDLASSGEQTMYSLTWSSALGAGRSHYLAGKPPFALHEYGRWADAVGLSPNQEGTIP